MLVEFCSIKLMFVKQGELGSGKELKFNNLANVVTCDPLGIYFIGIISFVNLYYQYILCTIFNNSFFFSHILYHASNKTIQYETIIAYKK